MGIKGDHFHGIIRILTKIKLSKKLTRYSHSERTKFKKIRIWLKNDNISGQVKT